MCGGRGKENEENGVRKEEKARIGGEKRERKGRGGDAGREEWRKRKRDGKGEGGQKGREREGWMIG